MADAANSTGRTILCTKCNAPLAVVDSRRGQMLGDEVAIRRRRACTGCGDRYTTYEIREDMIEPLLAAFRQTQTFARYCRDFAEQVLTKDAPK